ncbi:hypothetical protein A8C56_20850 [Niabella ginsenosidivorans]|uniref:Transglutaminase-like domain-containing protein n=1 Tax=Niabella ginsenosidivorans TaxID=1176587 RepID=A0A1A9I8V3_9BACT|nr:hypothetical protein [Niabella ginsenosidivorans]ANH83102.1 hypothetical protein A8C56_20850 [Niabella ginsenosidivorans]
MEEQIFLDKKGRKYRLVNKTREVPRRTYLLGTLYGKYWGEMDGRKELEYKQAQFYDFHIYEAEVSNAAISRTPFTFTPDVQFPRERLPKLLPVIVEKDGKEYELNIHEPQIANVHFIAALHQTEGNEVFGTIEARITGYLLDFCTEDYEEKEYLQDVETGTAQPVKSATGPVKTVIPTGNIEFKNGYQRTEYYYSNYKTKYWGEWQYKRPLTTPVGEGCLSSSVGVLSGIIGLVFLVLLLPKIAIMLPFLLLSVIFRLVPELFWTWIFRGIGAVLLAGIIVSIINTSQRSEHPSVPKSIVQDKPKERKRHYYPVTDTVNQTSVKDSLITHYRSWKDYDGNEYAGKFWVKKSALMNASSFKNNLNSRGNTEDSYKEMVYRLKENDKNNLPGVYQLFDSIRTVKHLPADKFAELIVSFVQDIPYTVVLPDACDGSLYADNFIKSYLSGNDARCDGYERFGINTPVEFMATLSGDCDTRTLLLYTMLSHYSYDVAMLNSNYYNHSLIGINLPYSGIAYTYNAQRYVLWETTAAAIKPGIIPNKITNLNYWSISLKSE